MVTGRPTDVDAEGWFELAVQLDQNRAINEAFQASYQLAPAMAPAPAYSNSCPGLVSVPRHTPPQPATRFAHTNPTPGNPVPMDIDAACRGKLMPDTCRRCSKTGHWAKDCNLRFNVHHMTVEELEAVMEDCLAVLDVAPQEMVGEPLEQQQVPTKDFVHCSK